MTLSPLARQACLLLLSAIVLCSLPATAQPDAAESKLERAARKGESRLQAIELHGRVEDQHGQSVPGVQIVYEASGLYLVPGSGRATLVSDARGAFHIQNARGVDLSFPSMARPGYQFRTTSEGDLNPQRMGGGQWKRYTRQNPAVFVLWKADQFPRLERGTRPLYMEPQAEGHTLAFGQLAPLSPGRVSGDIHVVFQRSPTEWSVRLSAIDGGLQEQTHPVPYPYIAPATGYTPVLEYRFPKSERSDLDKRLYFQSRNGQVHGYLELKLSPYFNDELSGILMRYVVNTNKSRDLSTPAP